MLVIEGKVQFDGSYLHCLRLAIGSPFYSLWHFLLYGLHMALTSHLSAGEHMLQPKYISLSRLFAHTEMF